MSFRILKALIGSVVKKLVYYINKYNILTSIIY